MASITPGGSATPVYGAIPSFPLLPQAWPLSSLSGNGLVGVTLPNQNPGAGAAHVTALTESGHSNDRLI